jgi:hypothetical protein
MTDLNQARSKAANRRQLPLNNIKNSRIAESILNWAFEKNKTRGDNIQQ